jgi:hypothetical protein
MIQDTGMRPEEGFGIRIESINWTRRFDLPITNYPPIPPQQWLNLSQQKSLTSNVLYRA